MEVTKFYTPFTRAHENGKQARVPQIRGVTTTYTVIAMSQYCDIVCVAHVVYVTSNARNKMRFTLV